MKSFLKVTFVVLALTLSLVAQPKPAGKKFGFKSHALVKVVLSPVSGSSYKKLLGTVVFATENVVDVAHGALLVADKGFTAASANGKIPVLDNIAAFVGTADKDSGKLDTWLERQEQYLFGTSN